MKRILLIDDDLDIQKLYLKKLANEGFEVHLAASSIEGLQALNEKKPDLILLDIMLPGKMNGFDLLERIKKDHKFKKIPVIVITSLDTERNMALKAGADDYMIKNRIKLNEFIEKIKKMA